MIVKITEKVAIVLVIDKNGEINFFTLISANYSLMRYLQKIMLKHSLIINNSGYVCIKRENSNSNMYYRMLQ